jgi:hypothetical protein
MVRAFKLYTGADKASHVLEGTIDEKYRTEVVAIHFEKTPAPLRVRPTSRSRAAIRDRAVGNQAGPKIGSPAISSVWLPEHWDVLQDEATEAESQSGLPMFGTKFSGRDCGRKS